MNDLKAFCENLSWSFLSDTDVPSTTTTPVLIILLLPKWSDLDLEIVSSLIPMIEISKIPVEVFDIDIFMTQDKLRTMFPGIPVVTQTPVLIQYVEGKMKTFLQGEEVKNWNNTM